MRDDLVRLTVPVSQHAYPGLLRRVRARVEVDGEERELEFLTNHLEWSAWTIAELYRSRWQICGLLHLLLRYLVWTQRWAHSFTRLFQRNVVGDGDALRRCHEDGDEHCWLHECHSLASG